MNLAPISAKIEPDRMRVNVGDDVSIFCRIEGFPISQIRWIRDGRVILTENVSDRNDTETRSKRADIGILENKNQGELFHKDIFR